MVLLADLICIVEPGEDVGSFFSKVHVYKVKVKSMDGAVDTVVLHQYSDFVQLDTAIRAQYEHAHLFENIPNVPVKQNYESVEAVTQHLEDYLNKVLKLPFVEQVDAVWTFVDMLSPTEKRRNSLTAAPSSLLASQAVSASEEKLAIMQHNVLSGAVEVPVLSAGKAMVWVSDARVQKTFEGDVVLYEVRFIDAKGTVYTEMHRFDHFVTLDRAVRPVVEEVYHRQLPALPSQKWSVFGSGGSSDPAVIEERRVAIEHYLNALIAVPDALKLEAVVNFFFV